MHERRYDVKLLVAVRMLVQLESASVDLLIWVYPMP